MEKKEPYLGSQKNKIKRENPGVELYIFQTILVEKVILLFYYP